MKGKENPGQAEQRQRSVRSQPLKSPPQPSGQHLRLPTCRLGRLQEPGPFGSGHFQRQLVKTLGVGPGYANDSKEVGTSWQLSLSMSDTTWGLSACAPSRYSPRPTAQARRLLIPPLPRLHPQGLSAIPGKRVLKHLLLSTITRTVPCPGSCHIVLTGLPISTLAPSILPSTQQSVIP